MDLILLLYILMSYLLISGVIGCLYAIHFFYRNSDFFSRGTQDFLEEEVRAGEIQKEEFEERVVYHPLTERGKAALLVIDRLTKSRRKRVFHSPVFFVKLTGLLALTWPKIFVSFLTRRD